MTSNTEQEAFSLVIQRQKSGNSESDIRYAFMTFMQVAGVAGHDDMKPRRPQVSATPAGWTPTSTTRASSSRPTSLRLRLQSWNRDACLPKN